MENKIYDLIDINDIAHSYDSASDKSDFLNQAARKNIQVIIYIKINDGITSNSQQNKGESATELKILIKADVFSIKKIVCANTS
jgi:hypothetical protein